MPRDRPGAHVSKSPRESRRMGGGRSHIADSILYKPDAQRWIEDPPIRCMGETCQVPHLFGRSTMWSHKCDTLIVYSTRLHTLNATDMTIRRRPLGSTFATVPEQNPTPGCQAERRGVRTFASGGRQAGPIPPSLVTGRPTCRRARRTTTKRSRSKTSSASSPKVGSGARPRRNPRTTIAAHPHRRCLRVRRRGRPFGVMPASASASPPPG